MVNMLEQVNKGMVILCVYVDLLYNLRKIKEAERYQGGYITGVRVAAKHFCHRPFLLKIEFLTSYGILSRSRRGRIRSRRERLLELGSRGCSEPPDRGLGGEASWKLWISEHLEGLDEFILNTYQLKSGRKTHYKNYHNLLEYILF